MLTATTVRLARTEPGVPCALAGQQPTRPTKEEYRKQIRALRMVLEEEGVPVTLHHLGRHGSRGKTEFLIEGLREGTHTFDISAAARSWIAVATPSRLVEICRGRLSRPSMPSPLSAITSASNPVAPSVSIVPCTSFVSA